MNQQNNKSDIGRKVWDICKATVLGAVTVAVGFLGIESVHKTCCRMKLRRDLLKAHIMDFKELEREHKREMSSPVSSANPENPGETH